MRATWTRYSFILGALAFSILALGFFFQIDWVTVLWPWPDGQLSYIFVASICAAMAAPMFWIGRSAEFGAARGGALNLAVSAVAIAVYLLQLYFREDDQQLLVTALVFASFVPLNIGVFIWAGRHPIRDRRATPGPVRLSFLVFCLLLIGVGSLLVLQMPTVFPWPLKPESSVIFGLIFISSSFFFGYGLLVPSWHNARGPLLAFLAYDLVLIGPFLLHFGSVAQAHLASLVLYILVLVYSGLLAVFYLFINPPTRSWQIRE